MMNIERKPFGKTARGEAVTLFEIRTPELTARILDYGATVQALLVPDKNGKPVDVVLGHDTIEGYETHDGYLGACVGRVANRLGGAQFTLNGKTYILAKNDGKNDKNDKNETKADVGDMIIKCAPASNNCAQSRVSAD